MTSLIKDLSSGTLSSGSLTAATTMTAATFAALPEVVAPDIMWVTADPDAEFGSPEIVKITAHSSSSTTVTVERAQGGTTARDHGAGTKVVAGLVKAILDEIRDRLEALELVHERTFQHIILGRSSVQTVSGNNTDFVVWNDEIHDPDGWHTPNSPIITIPFEGFYIVKLKIDLDQGSFDAYRYRTNSATPGSGGLAYSLTIGNAATNNAIIQSGQGNTSVFRFDEGDEFRSEVADSVDGEDSELGTGTIILMAYMGTGTGT